MPFLYVKPAARTPAAVEDEEPFQVSDEQLIMPFVVSNEELLVFEVTDESFGFDYSRLTPTTGAS